MGESNLMQIYEIFLTDFCIIVHEVWVGHIMTSVLHAGFFFQNAHPPWCVLSTR